MLLDATTPSHENPSQEGEDVEERHCRVTTLACAQLIDGKRQQQLAAES